MTLHDVFTRHQSVTGGGDKGSLHSYIDIYQKQMRRRRNIDLLEIGVWEGDSLAMWQEYFTDSRIVGVDINLARCTAQVDARLCDATNPGELQAALGDMQFDYIVDDGSHRLGDQVASFVALWGRLKPDGRYFIEDIQSDHDLSVLVETVKQAGAEPTVFDLRALKGRYDDILLMVAR